MKITLNELRKIVRNILKEGMETESLTDKELIDRINNLEESCLNKITYNVGYNWDDVDKDKLMEGILSVIKKVNPYADLDKKRMSLNRALSETNNRLYRAVWSSFSAYSGLTDYFKDNLYMFK
jgi:hypothetical protein